nr:hypothetical protein CPGR_05060 [Mycolicibacterium komanii]
MNDYRPKSAPGFELRTLRPMRGLEVASSPGIAGYRISRSGVTTRPISANVFRRSRPWLVSALCCSSRPRRWLCLRHLQCRVLWPQHGEDRTDQAPGTLRSRARTRRCLSPVPVRRPHAVLRRRRSDGRNKAAPSLRRPRVNKINLRREFFYATPEELLEVLKSTVGEVTSTQLSRRPRNTVSAEAPPTLRSKPTLVGAQSFSVGRRSTGRVGSVPRSRPR